MGSPLSPLMQIGRRHEQRTLDALRERGWDSELFGQSLLTEPMSDRLGRVDTPVRWMPDIIAGKNIGGRQRIVFVEAKGGTRYRDTGNHDIQVASLDAAEKWVTFAGGECPLFYIFDDLGVTTPAAIRASCWEGQYRGNGSGTPFVLFPTAICRPIDAIFGAAI